jgi:hypothetical protein
MSSMKEHDTLMPVNGGKSSVSGVLPFIWCLPPVVYPNMSPSSDVVDQAMDACNGVSNTVKKVVPYALEVPLPTREHCDILKKVFAPE